MSIFSRKQRNNLVLMIIILLAVLILYSLRDLYSAFLGAIILYTIFKPLYLYLKSKIGNVFSAVSIILISFIIFIIPFFTLSFMVVNKITTIRKDQFQIKAIISRLNDYLGLQLNQPKLLDNFIDKLSNFIQDLFPSVISGALGIFLILIVMYFLLFFMFTQSEEFEASMLKYAPLKEYHAKRFAIELKNTTYSNILGQGLIAFVQGMLVSICFFIVGIDDAIFWGVVSLFLSFMPVIGSPLVTLPAALILFLDGQTWQATFVTLFTLLIIVNIDNVIRFIINRKIANTHPIITVIGVLIGLPLFGAVGLVFGPLILSWFMHLVKIYEHDKIVQLKPIDGSK